MRQTLFVIPHELAGLPVFGMGWLLIGLAILFGVRLAWAANRRESVPGVLASEGVMWGIAAAVIAFVLPMVEVRNLEGEPIGMAVRGYGVMLLLAVVVSVWLAAFRAQRYGVGAESIYALAPWAFIGGIVGARLFYVIQYWNRFETVRDMLVFTEGGLVVYGGILGGFAASIFYLWRQRLPWLTVGDVIIPCIFVGIALGRIGCLMNGCCYGGRCEPGPTAIEFPPGSPVYQEQLYTGELVGITIEPTTGEVTTVRSGSLAERSGVRVGQRVESIEPLPVAPSTAVKAAPRESVRTGIRARIGGQVHRWEVSELPDRALPVRAAQVLSSASALAMALILLLLSRWVGRPGVLMFTGLAGYAIVRFLLEIVRVDEGGRFGTQLSISQWVSLLVFLASVSGLLWLTYRAGGGRSTSISNP